MSGNGKIVGLSGLSQNRPQRRSLGLDPDVPNLGWFALFFGIGLLSASFLLGQKEQRR